MENNYSETSGMALPIASIGRRVGASFLDVLVMIIPAFIIGHIIPVVGSIIVAILYVPVLESSELRATFGKVWMGIQVVDISGRRITFRAALIRYFMKLVSSLLLFLGHFCAFFTQKKQALHDMIAETVVIYGRNEGPMMDIWFRSIKELFQGVESPRRGASTLSELERLQALREKGALTEDEFLAEKRKLMGSA